MPDACGSARPRLEPEWKAFLAERGVRVPRGVFVPRGAAGRRVPDEARRLRPPLAVKAVSAAIVHKTDVGAVRLGVAGDAALVETIADMLKGLARRGLGDVAGVLVEEMADPGVELMVAVTLDPTFGRLLAFGLGGAGVEAQGEVRFFSLPLRPFDVETVLTSIPWLVATLRRTGEAGLRDLRELLWRFGGPGGLALDPDLERLELNPLIVGRSGAVAVDARGAFAAC